MGIRFKVKEEILLFTTYFLARECDLKKFHEQYLRRVEKARDITDILYVTDEIKKGGDEITREVMLQDFRRDMRDFGQYPFDESEWNVYSISCIAQDVEVLACEGANVSRLWVDLALGEETVPREFTSYVSAVTLSRDGRGSSLGSVCPD